MQNVMVGVAWLVIVRGRDGLFQETRMFGKGTGVKSYE
jgi:hypothetical protein